jgi:hypothetical protein
LCGGEYVSELQGECFVKVSEPVGETVDNFVLCSLRFCCFRQEYFDVLIREASEVCWGVAFIDKLVELGREMGLCQVGVSLAL